MKTKEILPGSRGDDATDTPSLLPQQACPLTIFSNGQQRQPHPPQVSCLSVNTEDIDGEEERWGM